MMIKKINKNFYWAAAIVIAQIFLLVNLKFTAWPEMLLWPYLMTKGWLPYANIAIAHTPLMLFDLSVFYKIFGAGVIQLKMFTWILIVMLDALVYWVSIKLWNKKTALISLAAFSLLALFYDANGLWFDIYMGTLAFVSFYFAVRKKWFWTGFFWALALISKQTAVYFLIPIAIGMIQDSRLKIKALWPSLKNFVAGSVIILCVFAGSLLLFGILPDFYNWAIRFGIFILPRSQGQISLPDIKNLAVAGFPFLIFIPFFLKRSDLFKKVRPYQLALWALTGTLGAYPRFEFFHFQPALPYLAIAAGILFTKVKVERPFFKVVIVFYLVGSLYLLSSFFVRSWGEGVRFYESDVQDITSYLKTNTKKDDKIFVMNWWDSVYALSGTLPATDPWVPQLSWYQELPNIQDIEVENLKATNPEIIVLNPYTEAGLSSYVPQKVYDYVSANYILKEKIDGIEVLKIKKSE